MTDFNLGEDSASFAFLVDSFNLFMVSILFISGEDMGVVLGTSDSEGITWKSNSPFRTILNFLDSSEGSEMQDAHKANSIIAPRSKFLFFLILIAFEG